jgi:hypothetical protein
MEYRILELALPAVVSHVLPPKKVQRIAGGPRHEMREMPVVLREQIPLLSQRTRTESPQIKTTQNCHQYVKGASRGNNDLFADLVDRERADSRVGIANCYPW